MMVDRNIIKALAQETSLRLTDLVPMAPTNDPFLADQPARRAAAEWFAKLFREFGFGQGVHVRRIHYRIVSAETPIKKPDGSRYENTKESWQYLVNAGRDARYLDLVPSVYFVDRRNPEPEIYHVVCENPPAYIDSSGISLAAPDEDFPQLPSYQIGSLTPPSPFFVEVWCEKTTMNDILVSLCCARGVNFVAGAGEMSETATRMLMERAVGANKPVRIFYVSDFDPAGRSMPVAVARRVEFYLYQHNVNIDLRLIPLVLTEHQCAEFRLPRAPIKDTERRASKFEARFGEGATELDALEALHPGELRRIVDRAINRYLDPEYRQHFYAAADEYRSRLRQLNRSVDDIFELDELRMRYAQLLEQWQGFQEDLTTVFDEVEVWLKENSPVPFVPPEHLAADEPDDVDVLFDSRRDYLSQADAYQTWRGEGCHVSL